MKFLSQEHPNESVAKFAEILTTRYKIFADKNKDYGSSYDVDGLVGIIIRLGDKLKRLKNVSQNGYTVAVKDEGLTDLFLDIANYCDIGLMLMEKSYGEGKETADSCDKSQLIQQSEDNRQAFAKLLQAKLLIGE